MRAGRKLGGPAMGEQMAKGVFIHRSDSIYDDSPALYYPFPSQYLSRARQFVGDWVVYYEPTKVPNSRGYFAMARVLKIVADESAAGMYRALIEPGSYLDFSDPVPFVSDGAVAETGLLNEVGRLSGRAQAAVRVASEADFERIVARGVEQAETLLPRNLEQMAGLAEEQAPFDFEVDRLRQPMLVSRIMRDRVFRKVVLRAYDERCGVTGLKLINGGGRAEVAAAHIRPVESNGPDIVNNGIALSGTAHWMFDRGLITFGDDLEIIVSRHVNDRDGVESLINKTRKLIGPSEARNRPHPTFLAWHRDNCFKQ
jgi:putative restriction endonuclease